MKINYQIFNTTQVGAHKELLKLVTKYSQSIFLRPIPDHQLQVFEQIKSFAKNSKRPLIIDSCCGTGLSTSALAKKFPNHAVVGIDKSISRLSRAQASSADNFILVRADVIDQWRLLLQEKLPITHHYLLYPNPWPKASHLKRRFYAHPIFRQMLSLAPHFELRTNWQIYAQECALALKALGQEPKCYKKADSSFITLFEKKYLETGCPIFLLTNQLNDHD